MSYERRLELEALPAEAGWGKWVGVVGFATEFVERKQLQPVRIWIYTEHGPDEREVYRYENWQFAKDGRPIEQRWFSYTEWITNYEYRDYSLRRQELDGLCAETREELCTKVRVILETKLGAMRLATEKLEATLAKFQPQ